MRAKYAVSRIAVLAALMFIPACASIDVAPTNFSAPRAQVKYLDGENGSCSGVVIAPNLILTAKHCGESGNKITVGGKEATVLRVHPTADLMLLQVEVACPCAVPGAPPEVDEEIIIVGFPHGAILGPTQVVTQGRAQGVRSGGPLAERFGDTLVLTALAAGGNSGGGVFALRGGVWQLVGILVAKADSTTLAIDTATVFTFIGT